jgi:hypothetical protein
MTVTTAPAFRRDGDAADPMWPIGRTYVREPLLDMPINAGLSLQTMLPSLLWHYTNREGLQGILGSRSLRATHCLYLEDPSEFRFAGEVMRGALEQLMDEETAPAIRDPVVALQRLISSARPIVTPDLYVCCFTTQGDNPNVWRRHTRPPDAFSIGIGGGFLFVHSLENWQLRRCVYQEPMQHDLVHTVLKARVDQLKTGDDLRRVLPALTHEIVGLAPILKRRDFEDEDEWRIIHYPSWFVRHPEDHEPDVHIARKAYPYIVFPFDGLLPRVPIILGPGPAPRPDENQVIAMAAASRIIATASRSTVALRDLR